MFASFFASATALVSAHPYFAYATVLLLALSESIPVIGVVVPGTATILAISALVPSGVVTLWPLLVSATAGAIIGDGVSFWLGHRYHREILGRWPLNRYPDLLTRSETFFARHGDKSVFIARFTPGVRAFIPLIAGMLKMSVSRFYIANILSALVWAPSHILPAVFVGAAFSLFGPAAKPLAILLAVLVVVIWAMIHLVRFALRHGPPFLSNIAARLHTRAARHDSSWARITLDLLDPVRSDARWLAALTLLLIGSAWLFFGILEDVVSGDPLVRADTAVYHALQDLRTVPGDRAMLAITEFGDTFVVIAVTAAVFLWLLWKRAWRTAAFWLTAIAGASAINTAIKVALHRTRPGETFYIGWSAFSFPSGHSTVNLVLYGALAFLIGRELRPAWRLPVALIAMSFALLIAFSRLYLGAHWFSDVLGGLAFGSTWLAILGFFYTRRPTQSIGSAGLMLVACLAVAFAGGMNVYRHHALDVVRYASKTSAPVMPANEWWSTGWQQLPARRIDLTGELEEPLTLQWAGTLESLKQKLLLSGWQEPRPWTITGFSAWFSTSEPHELPVVPLLETGRMPNLTLVRVNNGIASARQVLRFWPTDHKLQNGVESPIWVGSVVEEQISRPLSFITIAQQSRNFTPPMELLAKSLAGGRFVTRDVHEDRWDGRVLLAQEPLQGSSSTNGAQVGR